MTVRELIARLEELPEEVKELPAVVCPYDYEGCPWLEIERVQKVGGEVEIGT